MSVAPLPVEAYRDLVSRALAEDIGGGDATSALTLEPGQRARGVLLAKSGLYRVKAEIDSSCKGHCDGSLRISGSANHKLVIVPSCQPRGAGFVCSRVKIVKVY